MASCPLYVFSVTQLLPVAYAVHRLSLKRLHLEHWSVQPAEKLFERASVGNKKALLGNVSMWLKEGAARPEKGRFGENGIRESLYDHYNTFYLATVALGTRAVRVRLVVDTGSSDTWVKRDKYGQSSSSSGGMPISLSYGAGAVLGMELKDKVCLASCCIRDATIVAAGKIQGIDPVQYFDGVFGLALPQLRKTRGETFLMTLEEQNSYDHLVFGLSLNGHFGDCSSFITFGELRDVVNEAPNSSNGVFLPTNEFGYWEVSAKVSFKDGYFGDSPDVVLDSGTSLIAIPEMSYSRSIKKMLPLSERKWCTEIAPAKSPIICDCNIELDPLIFTFVDHVTEQSLDITLKTEDLLQRVNPNDGSTCRLSIQASPADIWILGDTFLRHVYVIHDLQARQVGFFHKNASLLPYTPASHGPSSMASLTFATAVIACTLGFYLIFEGLWAASVRWCPRKVQPLLAADIARARP